MTTPAHNNKKAKRAISGIFLLDKRQGISSNKALQEVKHLFSAEKAGHTGALDPMATGLLPICLGEATKFSHYLLDAQKSYQTTVQLGSQTDTGDTEGETIATAALPQLTKESITKVLAGFMGKQMQTPPMYSALKKDGKKLYELARAGQHVARDAREIHIIDVALVGFTENSISLSVACSKGTYIRVLGEDIAKALGTLGHLTMLRRTQTGSFQLADAMSVTTLESISNLAEKDALLLPSHASLTHLSSVQLTEQQKQRVQMGQRLNLHEQAQVIFQQSGNMAIQTTQETAKQEVLMFCDTVFLGLATLETSGRLQPKRIVKV